MLSCSFQEVSSVLLRSIETRGGTFIPEIQTVCSVVLLDGEWLQRGFGRDCG